MGGASAMMNYDWFGFTTTNLVYGVSPLWKIVSNNKGQELIIFYT